MNTFGKNVRFLRRMRGISQDQLADKLGYKSFTTIQRWETGDNEPNLSTIKKVAEIFQIDIDKLIKEDLDSQSDIKIIGRANVMRSYKYIDSSAAAGKPIPIEGQNYSKLSVPDSMLGKYANQDIFFINISGDSMNKIIPDGSLIGILEFKSVYDIQDGDIVAFNHDYCYSVKRYFYDQEHNRIIFRPESTNPRHTDIIYNLDEEEVQIIGKVVMYNVMLD